jgi:predicted RNase H-like nuclease
MKFIGVDGTRKGWICVWIDGAGHRGFFPCPTIADVARRGATRIMIDIPIGLPDSGYRACDLAAREMLGPARSRVFLGVRRGLLAHVDDFAGASALAKRDGKGISIQMFHLLPKIREVDATVTARRQRAMREMHPELVFFRLNAMRPVASKKSEAGLRQRRALLRQHGFDELAAWRQALIGTGVREDDLLDACAGALAAIDPQRVACRPETDGTGLRMDIWY